jgi:hypothetical protein
MNDKKNICQSCGMPLANDPTNGGTNIDGSKNEKYCGFCYQSGRFTDEGITLQEKIENNIKIAVAKMNIPESQAREMAERQLPNLERWAGK